MINPQLPGVGRPQPFAGLSPLKGPGQPPESPLPQPGDQIEIAQPSRAEKPQAPKCSKNWWKAATFGALGTGLVIAGSIAGGAASPALSASTSKPQANVRMQTTTAAPRTLQQQQATGIQLERMQFSVTPTVRNFNNAPAEIRSEEFQDAVDGRTHDMRIDRLVDKAEGYILYTSSDAAAAAEGFQTSADSQWHTSSVLRPAGNVGKYVSVSETTSTTAGPTRTQLRTVDTETGKVVNLSELLSPEQYQTIAKDVLSGLNSLQGLQYRVDDMETLDSHMNNGFSLHQSPDGQTKLTVGIPSPNETLGNKLAEFTFTLPANTLQ